MSFFTIKCKQQKFYDGISIIVILIPTRLIEYKSNLFRLIYLHFLLLHTKWKDSYKLIELFILQRRERERLLAMFYEPEK